MLGPATAATAKGPPPSGSSMPTSREFNGSLVRSVGLVAHLKGRALCLGRCLTCRSSARSCCAACSSASTGSTSFSKALIMGLIRVAQAAGVPKAAHCSERDGGRPGLPASGPGMVIPINDERGRGQLAALRRGLILDCKDSVLIGQPHAISTTIRVASAAVSVAHVDIAWTLLERRPKCTCTQSKPGAVTRRPSSSRSHSPSEREDGEDSDGQP